jgi:predicted nucleic acid-binding protein
MARRVFLDVSALFAGAYSPTGTTRALMRLSIAQFYMLYTNEIAVEEAERALQSKVPEAIAVFRALLVALPILIKSGPKRGQIERAQTVVTPTDAPILAGAIACKADFLATLDRQHLIGIDVSHLTPKLVIATPGDILGLTR